MNWLKKYLYKKDLSKTHIIPIGKPLYNNNIYILSNNNLCPINIPGELYVSGKGVGSGSGSSRYR